MPFIPSQLTLAERARLAFSAGRKRGAMEQTLLRAFGTLELPTSPEWQRYSQIRIWRVSPFSAKTPATTLNSFFDILCSVKSRVTVS
jgi:hypothetical protein